MTSNAPEAAGSEPNTFNHASETIGMYLKQHELRLMRPELCLKWISYWCLLLWLNRNPFDMRLLWPHDLVLQISLPSSVGKIHVCERCGRQGWLLRENARDAGIGQGWGGVGWGWCVLSSTNLIPESPNTPESHLGISNSWFQCMRST